MEPGRSPAQLIADSEGLLLDFDGPICDVYAGSDPARIAREVAAAFNLDIDTDDPLDLITHALATGGQVQAIHQALTETEMLAIKSATRTKGAQRLMGGFPGPIAIVSNNSAEAITRWLERNRLRGEVGTVVGRDPWRMKPRPEPLLEAVEKTERHVSRCLFVGDSLTDLEAARRAGVRFIGLANRPSKRQLFAQAGGDHVIESMTDLLTANTPPSHDAGIQ